MYMRAPHMLLARVSLGFLIFCGSIAAAQETIQLRPGHSMLKPFSEPIGTVVIGNPNIADATVQSERQIVVTAKTIPGTTNIMVLDANNKLLYEAELVVVPPSPELRIPGLVHIHSRGRLQLHEYYAYNCPPEPEEGKLGRLCYRVRDVLESSPRFVVNERLPLPAPSEPPAVLPEQPVPLAVPTPEQPAQAPGEPFQRLQQ